jgi:hypothetical protein
LDEIGHHSCEVGVYLLCLLYANSVVHCVLDLLLAAKIALRGLNRNVPKEEMDLFEFSAGHVAQPSACSTQVVRRNFLDANHLREFLDHIPDDLLRQSVSTFGDTISLTLAVTFKPAKREKQMKSGWIHSMCLKCFRKRWPHGKYSSWQVPVAFRQREVCCFCLQKHKDGIHKTRDPLNRELRCGGIHQTAK